MVPTQHINMTRDLSCISQFKVSARPSHRTHIRNKHKHYNDAPYPTIHRSPHMSIVCTTVYGTPQTQHLDTSPGPKSKYDTAVDGCHAQDAASACSLNFPNIAKMRFCWPTDPQISGIQRNAVLVAYYASPSRFFASAYCRYL